MIILIFGEHTYHFSSRLVQIGMFLWQIIRFRKPRKIYNHWGFKIYDKDENYEAIAKGVEKTNRKLASNNKIWSVVIYPEAFEYLNKQVGKKYEYSNFLFHAFRIIFPKWFGNKTDKRHSCVELVSRTLIKSGYNINVWSNPVELEDWLNKNF
jgi:hypothetical protein